MTGPRTRQEILSDLTDGGIRLRVTLRNQKFNPLKRNWPAQLEQLSDEGAVAVFDYGNRERRHGASLSIVPRRGRAAVTKISRNHEAEAAVWADQFNALASQSPLTDQAPSQDTDPLAQIERLAVLRDKGIISTEEFEAKKTELMGRL